MEWIELAREYVCPELLLLVPVLYILGMAIKKTELINDKLIPILLCIAGVSMAGIYMASVTDAVSIQSVFGVLFAALVQGILCAGVAVLSNQVYKQTKK